MFEAKLSEGSVVKRILEALKELVNEANLDCRESGITLQAMESSHTALVTMELKGNGFEKFRCDRNISLGVKLSSFFKMIKSVNPDDSITLRAQEEPESLEISFENKNGDEAYECELKLMSVDSERLEIPDSDPESTIKMNSAVFARIVRDLGGFGNSTIVKADGKSVRFGTSGDTGSVKVALKPIQAMDKDMSSVEISSKNPVEVVLSTKLLVPITKASSLSEQVTIGLSNDRPASFDYQIDKLGYLRYYLAPKCPDDPDEARMA